MPLFSPEVVAPDRRADLAACRASLAQGSRSFFVASLLLPRAVREPASALYAFCRYADDAIDQQQGGADAVAALREQLGRIYAGQPSTLVVDRALAHVVEHFHIPRSLLDALIEGFEWDAQARRYETLADLEAYAARVAGTVGAMMAMLMGAHDAAVIARACELGVAMQLTNIARDVGEDARAGRIYLPLSWLREAGIDPASWLASPQFDPALAQVVERLLRAADALYARVDAGVAALPAGCRPGINAARFLYAEIGCEVARSGFDSVSRRAVVSASRKLQLLGRAFITPVRLAHPQPIAALAANDFLVAAVTALVPHTSRAPALRDMALQWWRLDARWVRVIELFDRLERVERDARGARVPAGLSPRTS